jgi:hypothetical protein
MQLTCPRCRHVLEFSGDRPSFCGYCGSALADTKACPPTPFDPEAPTLAPHPAAPAQEAVPEVVGGYRLLRVLGGGGMGTVYEAEDTASGRRVALKLISPDYAASADAVQRFRQEGRLASAIAHPRCVFVLAADEEDGRPYIVMELMPGSTLEDQVGDKGPLPPEKAIAAILDVIEGLEEAHRHGVIHRDVKPSNCFLDAEGRLKVGDFGLSKSLAGNARLTRTGAFLGTPLYASPEQIKGEPLDPQTDVYSVAATIYFLLTGRAPFQSGDMAATLARIVSDPAPSMRTLRPDLDPRLDQVVLRGLERDRGRRWRNLADFRAALQEFLPGRLSIGSLGIRFGAFAVDWFLLFLAKQVVGVILVAVLGTDYVVRAQNSAQGWALQLSGMPPFFLYFALLEGIWGASLGKFLFRLRVRRVRDGAAPGLVRGIARAAALTVLFDLNNLLILVGVALFLPADITQKLQNPEVAMRFGLQLSAMMLAGFVAGVGLVLLPMRRRNGYRGLHEFLSGTRVVLLPPAARRRMLHGDRFEPAPRSAEAHPRRLGAFVIRGALPGGDGTTVLVGKDAQLDRDVWIWLRPLSEPPLGDARRPLSRTTRLRWLACGTHADMQWDAFFAPAGSPLADIIRHKGCFAWPEVRPLLEGLTDELVTACEEETVPDPLRLEQVWVQPNGAVQVLDMPWGDEPAGKGSESEAPAAEAPTAERRARALLGQAAALALEGAARPAESAGPIRAPLPRHAAEMLSRLRSGRGSCRKFQAALHDTRDRPAELTRARRIAHLGILALLLFVGVGCCMFPAGWPVEMMAGVMLPSAVIEEEESLRFLDEGAWRHFAASTAGAGPACWPALGQLHADLALRKRLSQKIEDDRRRGDARLEALGPITRQQVSIGMKSARDQVARMEKDPQFQDNPRWRRVMYRPPALHALNASPSDTAGPARVMAVIALIALLTWPILWIVWTFLWRGGISYRIVEIDLVRSDGRPALRLQCAWRAFLVWAPVTGLLLLSLWLQTRFWADWSEDNASLWLHTLSSALWYAALALLAAYVALAIARPTRSLHDRLAGTYLVPR